MWKTESLSLIAILVRLIGIVFNCDVRRTFGVFVLLCTIGVPAFGQTSVLTQHNDNARTGQNTSETILNTSNVNANEFGKLFAMPVDGQVYAQPLYVPGVTINGGVHNVVIIATENDSVYAYDADSTSAVLLWKTKASLVDAAHGAGAGETALNSATTTGCGDMPQVGITSTPVIDPTSKTIYVEAKSTNGTNYFHRLHALDLLTGNEKTPGPVVITGTVSGTGDGSSNGQLAFDNLHQLNRPGLLLLNGTIYLAYASHCDHSPYHGWLFAYDAATFTQKSVYVTSPNGGMGGFWMSGAGVAADASGNIFIASGNGDFDTTHVPATETGDTILKLGTSNQILTQLDYFTPQDQANLQGNDEDLGAGGVLLLPDQLGPFPHILVEAGKEGKIYVVNRDQMTTNNSHYCSGCTNDPEIIEESGSDTAGLSPNAMFNIAAYWNNTLYFWGASDVLKSIPVTNGLPDFTHVTGSTPSIGFPGAGISVSSNGTTAGSAIVWGIDSSQWGSPGPGPGPAVLYAYDATNVPKMLYSSAQNATRDAAGNAVKFAVPTVANGKVYIGTSTAVDVYGLVGANPLPNISSINPSSATAEGPAFPLTLTGTGFITGATINFGTSPAITPSSVTSTQIIATIPAADIATAGTVNVTVTNPAGGGTSNAQTFTINNPAPTATSLSPTSATAGDAAFTLIVNGTGFVSTSVVKFNGAAKTTTFVNATQLTAAITAADIATAGSATVTVTNPAPGGGSSGNLSFTINAASGPTLTSFAPTSATVGGAAFTLTLTGTGFVAGATVNFGSSPAITPSSVTGTQVVVTIPAADIATAGTVNVTVTNPVGGGTSNAQAFTINNPAPTATSLSPTSANSGGAAFTLTVNGTGFVSTSVVKFNGAAKTTTFVSATQLTAAITAADIATAGTATVTVTNPAPGGGTSGNLSFTINAVSGPTLTSIAPASSTVGGVAFTLTISGTGFASGATVNFGVNPAITPSSVTGTQVVVTIPAADISTAGTVNVTVTNPAGGGTSNAQTFTINNPAPTETSLSPTSATAGGVAFSLTVSGTGFVSTSVVKFNGAAKTTTFVSATQLTAAITAADIATAGTATVTVTNPAPGGGTSGNLSFTINAGSAPALTSIAPASSTVGGVAFTLTISGTGFASGATVNFGVNPAITPSSVTGTQVVVTIPAADISTAGTVNVTVTNPAGGGTSNAQTFTINNPAPTETSLSPTSATAGGVAFSLTVSGTGFVSTSVVKFNGAAKTTTFVSATQLTAAITAADIATAGTATVTVTNPAPGGGTSGNLSFTINAVSGPTLTSIAPASSTVGGVAFTLTISGTGFASGATVNFGVNPAITPSSVTGTQVVVTIPAADISTAGTVNVTVTNPAGGGTSNAQTFTINNPAPTETSLSPTSATAGGVAFSLTVSGTGFVSTSVVKFNGAAKTTTFVSATQLTAAITAADIATAGTATVTVTNPVPGGGTSGNVSFTINAGSAPTLTSIAPATAAVGGIAFTLNMTGTGFVAGATVNFGANPAITPSTVTSTQIVVTIPAADISTAGTVNITVTNPAGGGTSNAQTFTINNPAPTETSLSPTSATAGGVAFSLTVSGTGFVSTSVVKFNGAAKTTTFVSATQLTAAITAADIATAGTATVTVTNPAPGGGTSGNLSFTINAVSGPTLTSIAPASSTVGGVAFTLTISGTGFASGARVNFGSSPAITPSSVTGTQVVVTIPAADISTAGTVNVTVTNPAGGGTSNAQTFIINNPAPTATSLSPTSATAGGAAFTLTVNGTGFVSTSVVKFNGAAKTTTFVNATQLTAAITAADIATAGSATVTIMNPAPGGGTSGNLSFTINAVSGPTLTSIAPASAAVGGVAFTLNMTGTGFVTGATINFGTSPAITPSSVTSTQIVATIPATDIATAGTVNVTVTNPAGGGTSNAQTFTINNPAPTATSLSPTSANAGGAAFTLTVNGTGFVSTSVVKFNGATKTTTFVSATQLTAAITAADIATAGSATVTVTNPALGGTSNAVSFEINNAVSTISSLLPSSAAAGSAAFTLTVNGVGFVAGATVNFNGAPKATTFVSNTQLTAAILASDIATAGTANVTVINPAPTPGPSGTQVFTISSPNNAVPTISSLGPTHAPGGAAFTLTVNGTNFEAKSVVNFNGKPEATTFISATQISAAVSPSDVTAAGNVNVTVTNAPPGGGTSPASIFTVDGYSILGPSDASLTSSQPAMIQITATPTANGFTNSISFSVSGLPAGATASFNPPTLTLNGLAKPTMLTITNGSLAAAALRSAGTNGSGRLLELLLATWIVAILGWVYLHLQVRAIPIVKRYAALALFALILLTGSVLGGCALGVTSSPSVNTSQLTVTATSGTLTQTFGITLTVTHR